MAALVGYVLLEAMSRLGGGYDDGGIGSLAFGLGLIWNFVAFPYYLAHEALFALNSGQGFQGQEAITILAGLLFFGAAEVIAVFVRGMLRSGPIGKHDE